MEEKPITITKSTMYASVAILLLVISYLAYNHPSLNHHLASSATIEKEAIALNALSIINERNSKLKEWKWFGLNDVAVNNEKYPIVILRSGFKVIKISKGSSLVGWRMNIANTSEKNRYLPKVTYSLTDSDGFDIGSSSENGNILSESFGVVQGTMTISNSDLERLSKEDWTISIGSWSTNEVTAKGKRYDRLKAMVEDEKKRPYWLKEHLESNPLDGYFSEKWDIIKKIVTPEPPKENENGKVNK